jgi:hypothetical protein
MAEEEAIKEERKADEARSTVLLTPMPPHLTGSEACAQEVESSLRLQITARASLTT